MIRICNCFDCLMEIVLLALYSHKFIFKKQIMRNTLPFICLAFFVLFPAKVRSEKSNPIMLRLDTLSDYQCDLNPIKFIILLHKYNTYAKKHHLFFFNNLLCTRDNYTQRSRKQISNRFASKSVGRYQSNKNIF